MRFPQLPPNPTPWVRRVVLGAIVVAQAVASTLVAFRFQGRNIDDVWNAELWGSWRPFTHPILVPRDTFVLHAPINLAARWVFGDGLPSFAAATIVLNAIGMVLVLNFVGFLARRAEGSNGETLVLQVLVAVLYGFVSIELLYLLGRPNYRNVEIGLFLVAIQLVIRAAEQQRLTRSTGWIALLLGLIAFNDPMFLICGLAAWLVVIGLRWVLDRDTPTERRAAVVLTGGVVAFGVLRFLFGVAGVHISNYATPEFSDLTEFPRTASQTIERYLIVFGASFSNRNVEQATTWLRLFRLGLVALIGVGAWRFRAEVAEKVRLSVGAVVVPICAIMLASTFSNIGSLEQQNPRYLAPAVGLTVVLAVIPLAFGTPRFRSVIAVVIVIVGAIGVLDSLRYARGVLADGVDTRQLDAVEQLADALEREGATTGYAPMWVAVPTEYFSDSSVEFASLDCGVDGVPAVANFGNLAALDADSSRSFYVYWERDEPQCTRDQIIAAFGDPIDEVRFEFDDGSWGHFDVLWYDGNVGSDLDVAD